ncbi:MAG: hypothetical protein HYZ53_30155 [Planctomycetes bacterium]|nr:hypothetical protein [Planctomycetota bacterium]
MNEPLRRITAGVRQNEPGIFKEFYLATAGNLLLRRKSDAAGELVGFEVAFRRVPDPAERHVAWEKGGAAWSARVDTGEVGGGVKMTPLVDRDTSIKFHTLRHAVEFLRDPAHALAPDVREFLLARLAEGLPG